jgi:hypothetical protein
MRRAEEKKEWENGRGGEREITPNPPLTHSPPPGFSL